MLIKIYLSDYSQKYTKYEKVFAIIVKDLKFGIFVDCTDKTPKIREALDFWFHNKNKSIFIIK